MFQRILVPLDGSKLAEGVLPYAAALAKKLQAQITLLSIVPHEELSSKDADQPDYMHDLEEKSRTITTDYLHDSETRLQGEGVRVDTVTKVGNAPGIIVSYAEEGEFDLIAMSIRGRSGITRWMMGSVADHVLQATSTPLLLIKPDEKAEQKTIATINTLAVPLDGSSLAESIILYVEELAKRMDLEVVLVQALPSLTQLYLGIEPQAFPTDVMEAVEESATTYLKAMAWRLEKTGDSYPMGASNGRPRYRHCRFRKTARAQYRSDVHPW